MSCTDCWKRPNAPPQGNKTMLHRMAKRRVDQSLLVAILKESPDTIDAQTTRYGTTALFEACRARWLEGVETLIQRGASLLVQTHDSKWNVAHLLAVLNDAAVFSVVLREAAARGCKDQLLGATTSEGLTPLHIAAVHNAGVAVCVLSSAGVNLEYRFRGSTALHLAANNGHETAVLALISVGADVNAADKDGDTPLASALLQRDSKDQKYGNIINLLLLNGSDPERRNLANHSPLSYRNRLQWQLVRNWSLVARSAPVE